MNLIDEDYSKRFEQINDLSHFYQNLSQRHLIAFIDYKNILSFKAPLLLTDKGKGRERSNTR